MIFGNNISDYFNKHKPKDRYLAPIGATTM